MNKHLIITVLLLSTSGILLPGNRPPKAEKREKGPADFAGGVATQNLKDAIQIAAKTLSPENMGPTGKAISGGIMEGLDDKELAAKGKAFGDAAGAALVTGAAGAVKSGVLNAATAVVTAPVTPFIITGGTIVALVGYGYNIECQKEYGHCLRTHFDSPSVDEEKMPRRCHSPARRAFKWGNDWAGQQKRIFKILKEEGRRPRQPQPGIPYWSSDGPSVMGKDDLEQKNDK